MKNNLSFINMLMGVTLLLGSTSSFAQSDARNGGDEVGISFVTAIHGATADIEALGKDQFPGLDLNALTRTVLNMQVFVIEKAPEIPVTHQEIQSSAAENIPTSQVVMVYRARWNAIKDYRDQKSLALHEALCLMGIEKTGSYPVSGLYRSLLKTPQSKMDSGKIITKMLSCETADYSCPKVGDKQQLLSLNQARGRICTALKHLRLSNVNANAFGDDSVIDWQGAYLNDFLSALKTSVNGCVKYWNNKPAAYFDIALTPNTYGTDPKVIDIARWIEANQRLIFN